MNEIPEDLARRIRLVIFDVDGVLTDGAVYLGGGDEGTDPIELKRFDIQDGIGIKMLVWSGLEVAFVSGRVSRATALRAAELGIDECHQAPDAQKIPVVEDLLERKGIGWDETAMLADDLPDLAVLRRIGLRAAVGNAQPEVTEIADWQSQKTGGAGAVRDFCRSLLIARGEWADQVEAYVRARSGTQSA